MMANRVFPALKFRARLVLIASGIVALGAPVLAQASAAAPQAAPSKPLTYEVVSIKPHKAYAQDGMWWRTTPDGFSASGVALDNLIMDAYGLIMPEQISGLPGWTGADTFDIQAKMDEDSTAEIKKLPPKQRLSQMQTMMQAMLADRFQLKVHHEIRQLPVYDLAVAKGGAKLSSLWCKSEFRKGHPAGAEALLIPGALRHD